MVDADIPIPDYDDPEEVYAFFGLTFYSAQVLEQGLVNLAVALQAKGIPGITFKDANELYEAIDNQTFGRVLRAARELTKIPSHLDAKLQTALEKRNYLAHHFFVVHDHDILSDTGRRCMIDELGTILRFLKEVDRELDEKWMEAWEQLGINKDWIARQVQRFIASGSQPIA